VAFNADAKRLYAAEYQRTYRQRADVAAKNLARRAVRSAIERGVISRQPCYCGNPKAQAHHEDYSKQLQVMWLCVKCHREHHKKAKGP
jgi:ribosomal protein L44E